MSRVASGLVQPKKTSLRTELAGEIVVMGKEVNGINVGDQGFVFVGCSAFAQYVCGLEEGQGKRKGNVIITMEHDVQT